MKLTMKLLLVLLVATAGFIAGQERQKRQPLGIKITCGGRDAVLLDYEYAEYYMVLLRPHDPQIAYTVQCPNDSVKFRPFAAPRRKAPQHERM